MRGTAESFGTKDVQALKRIVCVEGAETKEAGEVEADQRVGGG